MQQNQRMCLQTSLMCCLLVIFSIGICSASHAQDETPLGDVARKHQSTEKKAKVIDNESLGVSPAGDPSANAPAASTSASAESGNSKKDDPNAKEAATPDADGNASTPSAKQHLADLKEKEKNWVKTLDVLQKKIDSAKTDYERELWTRDMESARDGLGKTQAEMKDAQSAADQEGSEDGRENAPAPADQQKAPNSQ